MARAVSGDRREEGLWVAVSSEARAKFVKGEAFTAAHPVEKTVPVEELGEAAAAQASALKSKFEKGALLAGGAEEEGSELTEEERAAKKKAEIESEFAKFKKIRKKQELKEQRERDEAIEAGTLPPEVPFRPQPPQLTAFLDGPGSQAAEGVLSAEEKLAIAEKKNIMQRFEDGTAFASDGTWP